MIYKNNPYSYNIINTIQIIHIYFKRFNHIKLLSYIYISYYIVAIPLHILILEKYISKKYVS